MIPMKSKNTGLVIIGAASYFLAWFVPVLDGGRTLSTGILPGWEAFRLALSPIWPYDELVLSAWYARPAWYWSVTFVVSALSNIVLVAALLQHIFMPNHRGRSLRTMVFACGVFNTSYLLFSERNGLRMGYYMWTLAYFLVAAGLSPNRTSEQGDAAV
jgi:hypothetical protein